MQTINYIKYERADLTRCYARHNIYAGHDPVVINVENVFFETRVPIRPWDGLGG